MRRIRYGSAGQGSINRTSPSRMGNSLFHSGIRGRARRQSWDWAKIGRFAAWALLALATMTLIGYTLWGPWLKLTDVTIDGASPLTEDRVRAIILDRLDPADWHFRPQSNAVVFSRNGLQRDIENVFAFATLNVTIHLPHRLVVTVTEKPIRAVFLQGFRFYALDETGHVIRELYPSELALLGRLPTGYDRYLKTDGAAELVAITTAPIVTPPADGSEPTVAPEATKASAPWPIVWDNSHDNISELSAPIRPGSPAFRNTATMETVLKITADNNKAVGYDLAWLAVTNSGQTSEAQTMAGWRALFGVESDFSTQAKNLSIALSKETKCNPAKLDYIDLQYGDRVFCKTIAESVPEEPKKIGE